MYKHFFKRFFDICISLIALPFFIPVFLIFAPIVYFTDRGPVFYNAERIGKDGRLFKMYKFRSMYVNSPDIRHADGSTYNGEDDPRVTKIGRFMRKTSIDELPQLLNILKGDMSLIGPRPDPPDDMYIYTEEEKKKLKVLPGITGYSQAYYRNSVEQSKKFANDVYYSEHISFLFDIKIFIKTILVVVQHKNVYNDVSELTDEGKQEIEIIKK